MPFYFGSRDVCVCVCACAYARPYAEPSCTAKGAAQCCCAHKSVHRVGLSLLVGDPCKPWPNVSARVLCLHAAARRACLRGWRSCKGGCGTLWPGWRRRRRRLRAQTRRQEGLGRPSHAPRCVNRGQARGCGVCALWPHMRPGVLKEARHVLALCSPSPCNGVCCMDLGSALEQQ